MASTCESGRIGNGEHSHMIRAYHMCVMQSPFLLYSTPLHCGIVCITMRAFPSKWIKSKQLRSLTLKSTRIKWFRKIATDGIHIKMNIYVMYIILNRTLYIKSYKTRWLMNSLRSNCYKHERTHSQMCLRERIFSLFNLLLSSSKQQKSFVYHNGWHDWLLTNLFLTLINLTFASHIITISESIRKFH